MQVNDKYEFCLFILIIFVYGQQKGAVIVKHTLIVSVA